MKIRKMTATFGSLDNAVLEPGDGLTVISAPNEAGKSTWAGFLKAMLYGIATRERDTAAALADKNRYQPWSGAPMSGELEIQWQGRDITLRRFPARTSPFGGFEAVYTATGDPVPGLTAANAGERLTGAGREVYLRSAFVGQGGAAIARSGELEARISALATAGQEDAAYSDVERTLRDWRNRRRANRANGLIPQLEEDISGLDAALRDMEQTRRRRAEAEQALARLEEQRKELQADLEIWDRLERHELNRRYAEAYAEWEKARSALPEGKPHPVFGAMTGEEAWAFAQEKRAEWEAAIEENRSRESARTRAEQLYHRGKQNILLGAVLTVICLYMVLVWVLDANWLLAALSGAVELISVFSLLYGIQLVCRTRNQRDCRPVPVPDKMDWLAQAAQYREGLAAAQQARAAADAARRRVEDLAAQGGQLADTLEMLHPPAQPKAATATRLAAVEGELARTRDELARTEGILAHMGGPEELEARKGEREARLRRRMEEYDALTIALDALGAANDALRERFSPALNRAAGEIFSALTGGRWGGLSLARDFTAQASQEGGGLPRSWLALSAGTADQLYLAVRLAICALTVPGAPMVLDDALTAFDEERCALALDYLSRAARERQILLFSCHGREGAWADARGIPVIRL